MPLSKNEIDELVRLIRLTKDIEIDCSACLALVAEFAEAELSGKTISDGLRTVEHHLSVCGECRQEYECLQRALGKFDDE